MTMLDALLTRIRRPIAVVMIAAGFAATAKAETFDIGLLADEPYVNSVLHEAGSFLDTYNFSVSRLTNIAIGAVSNELSIGSLGSVLSIDRLKVGVFNATNTSLLSFPLTPGDYFVEVSGTADGRNGGAYLLSMVAAVAPVPEPELWLTLLAGTLLIPTLARRARG